MLSDLPKCNMIRGNVGLTMLGELGRGLCSSLRLLMRDLSLWLTIDMRSFWISLFSHLCTDLWCQWCFPSRGCPSSCSMFVNGCWYSIRISSHRYTIRLWPNTALETCMQHYLSVYSWAWWPSRTNKCSWTGWPPSKLNFCIQTQVTIYGNSFTRTLPAPWHS